ncbi:MAG: hypothetical protein ACI9WU_000720 [Myxococcota bacterium]|jgi:hypothetical protein
MLLVVLVLLVPFVAAVAQEQKQDPEKAQEAFEAARVAYENGNFKLSVSKLREAFRWYPDPAIKVSIARRLVDLDEPEEALSELKSIVPKGRRMRKAVEGEIAKVEALLARPVDVTVETDPPGALIKINDEPSKGGPITRGMPRGPLRLAANMPGYKPTGKTVTVKGTKPMKVLLTLGLVYSFLRVELTGVDPERGVGAPVLRVDNKVVTPGTRLELAPGRHTISCGYARGGAPTTLRVNIPEGKDALVRCALPAPIEVASNWKTPAGWASVGSGGAALAVGIGMLVSYAVETSTYQEPRYTIESTSKPLVGGIAAGVGAGLVGLGTWFLLSD